MRKLRFSIGLDPKRNYDRENIIQIERQNNDKKLIPGEHSTKKRPSMEEEEKEEEEEEGGRKGYGGKA